MSLLCRVCRFSHSPCYEQDLMHRIGRPGSWHRDERSTDPGSVGETCREISSLEKSGVAWGGWGFAGVVGFVGLPV
jgi:hypothetical protein